MRFLLKESIIKACHGRRDNNSGNYRAPYDGCTDYSTYNRCGKEIISVIGYDYESAKNKLEEQGFKVAEGNHLYSTLYSEGYVISQSPESGTSKTGHCNYT